MLRLDLLNGLRVPLTEGAIDHSAVLRLVNLGIEGM
jgi:hypothetical protein